MERERLTELLQHPALAAKQDLAALRDLAVRFPWFSGAQLLLAVGRHGSGDVLTNGIHGNPAAFLPSRAVLYDLLQAPEQGTVHQWEPPAIAPAIQPLPVEAVPASVTPPLAVPDVTDIPAQLVKHPVSGTEEEQPLSLATDAPPTAEAPAIFPSAPTTLGHERPEPPNAVPPPVPDPASDILEQQIQEAIRASGYQIHDLAAQRPEPAETPSPQPYVEPAATAALPADPPQLAPNAEDPIVPRATKLKFTDWLDQQVAMPGLREVAAPPVSAPIPKQPAAAPVAAAAAEPVPSAAELMEKFIRRGEAEIKPKAAFFNPQQAAKKSLEDHGMVSETLARILEKQGNFTKAKEVYDRLALKHPEKSVYFAALSKALEGRSNK
ncbi:MAG: hypothetical protein JST38_05705 [Bacteroidetes bacterium]|nr:hypothetical protein [Bacteroidota bacterium]